jgi:hypothetical protein
MDILRDPAWQFIGFVGSTILGIIGIILSIYLYTKQKRREFTYDVVSEFLLLNINEEVKKRIKVTFDDKNIENILLVIIKVWNSGSSPIIPQDYIEPLTIDYGNNIVLLNTEITEKTPKELKINYKIDNNKIVLDPILLNSKDSFTIKAILNEEKCAIELKARIIGLSSIRNIKEEPQITDYIINISASLLLTLLYLMAVVALFTGLAFIVINSLSNIKLYVSFFIALFISVIFYTAFNLLNNRFPSRWQWGAVITIFLLTSLGIFLIYGYLP